MRFKILPALLIAFTALFFMSSCKKSNTQGRYIPANAAVIVHINAESLSAKLPWEEIKQNEFFKTLYADSSLPSYAKAALDNPENTGIDIKKDMVFFMVKDSVGAYVAFEGAIKDAAKFKAYNTEAMKSATASDKDGVHFISSNRTTVSWDDSKFIVVTNTPEVNQMNNFDKLMNRDSLQDITTVSPESNLDGNTIAAGLFALSEGNSMAKNEKFTELVTTKGDIHFWMNAEYLNAGTSTAGIPALSMINISKLYQGSIATGTLNFENGKIDVDMKSYAGKEMTSLWKNYAGDKISSDMVKRLPAKDVAFFLAMNFKPEGIKEFAKITGLEGLIAMGTAFLGFSLDDFVKANKGDILFVVSDILKDSTGNKNASVLFSASVGDKASFDKLITAGKKMGKDGMSALGSPISFNSSDKYFAIGNKKENIDQFIMKDGSSKFDFYDKIASSPIGGYINLQYIITSFKEDAAKDSLATIAMNASLKMWDNVIISGGSFNGGGITQHFEVNLIDKTTNSLKQLNNYIAAMGNIAQQKKKQNHFAWDNDLPVTDTVKPVQ